jgi:uroporphyrin-3 C-methyltransferase
LPDANEWQQIEGLVADLQRSQRALGQELDVLRGDARADWKLAEAEYLLRLASLRLLAAQDVESARELLEAVDTILRDQPDSGVFSVREELARVQAELDALPEIDRSGVYLRLAALHEQVNRLVLLPVPEFDPDEVSVEEEYEDRLARRTRAERVLMRLERYVRVDFQRGKVITPLLDEAEMQRVRRTLQLTMEQAQWAALRGESDIYLASLNQADGILRQFFELENPQVKAMQAQLAVLAERQVDLDPPALAALQQDLAAYIQSRRNLADNGGDGQ